MGESAFDSRAISREKIGTHLGWRILWVLILLRIDLLERSRALSLPSHHHVTLVDMRKLAADKITCSCTLKLIADPSLMGGGNRRFDSRIPSSISEGFGNWVVVVVDQIAANFERVRFGWVH